VYGSNDPDPFQNVTDLEHCVPYSVSQGRASSSSVHFDSRGCGPASNRIDEHLVGETSKVDFFDLTVGVDNIALFVRPCSWVKEGEPQFRYDS
jgi:hypothetical protein